MKLRLSVNAKRRLAVNPDNACEKNVTDELTSNRGILQRLSTTNLSWRLNAERGVSRHLSHHLLPSLRGGRARGDL
jgi:hypothetical protein